MVYCGWFFRSQWKLPTSEITRVSAGRLLYSPIHLDCIAIVPVVFILFAVMLISILILCSTGSFCPLQANYASAWRFPLSKIGSRWFLQENHDAILNSQLFGSGKGASAGAIAGGVVAGVIVLAAIFLYIIFYRRRKAKQATLLQSSEDSTQLGNNKLM